MSWAHSLVGFTHAPKAIRTHTSTCTFARNFAALAPALAASTVRTHVGFSHRGARQAGQGTARHVGRMGITVDVTVTETAPTGCTTVSTCHVHIPAPAGIAQTQTHAVCTPSSTTEVAPKASAPSPVQDVADVSDAPAPSALGGTAATNALVPANCILFNVRTSRDLPCQP